MMRAFRFARQAAALLCGAAFLLLAGMAQADTAGSAYTRVYVENRCYHTVDSAIEREKGDVPLPPVSPRDTAMVLFTWTKNIVPHEIIRLSRKDAEEKRATVQELLDGARHEKWVMGRHTVDSWFVTLCKKELPLDAAEGMTVRAAKEGERVSEYEMLFSRVPGSDDAMHILSDYPVRISLNGIPLHILETGKDGVLRFLLPEGALGTMTLEALPDMTRMLELDRDWKPVNTRGARAGEKLLIERIPASGPQDW